MNVMQHVKIGLMELQSNKLRSFLTMLGVIIGVAAVIASVAIGEGARIEALDQLALMGINTIRITAKKLDGQALVTAQQKNPRGLALDDVEAIRGNCPFVRNAAPVLIREESVRIDGRVCPVQIVATSPEYLTVSNSAVSEGRFLLQSDIDGAARVCVIGPAIRAEFGKDAIGGTVRIHDGIFRVVGVMEDKTVKAGPSGPLSFRNVNRDLIVPVSAAQKRMSDRDPNHEISEITVMVDSADHLLPAADLIRRILGRMHSGVENYDVIVPLELLKQSQATQRTFNIVLAAIAAISLLVGGIGIMNIMLASVTQRIREIGIRRAVGATRREILGQFLIEAVVMSGVGGVIGILAGILFGFAIARFAGWKMVFSLQAIVIAVTVSAAVGVFFGLYPARRAASLDPIEALRYE